MAIRSIREFIGLEAIAGIILFSTALLAVIIDNSSFATYYEAFFKLKFSFSLAGMTLEKPLLEWINDGFMTLFFFTGWIGNKTRIDRRRVKYDFKSNAAIDCCYRWHVGASSHLFNDQLA